MTVSALREGRELVEPKDRVAIQKPLGGRVESQVLLEHIRSDPPGPAIALDHGTRRRALRAQDRLNPQHTFSTHHADFQTRRGRTCRDQADETPSRKVDVRDGLTGLPEHLRQRKRHILRAGKQVHAIGLRQSRDQIVVESGQDALSRSCTSAGRSTCRSRGAVTTGISRQKGIRQENSVFWTSAAIITMMLVIRGSNRCRSSTRCHGPRCTTSWPWGTRCCPVWVQRPTSSLVRRIMPMDQAVAQHPPEPTVRVFNIGWLE